MIWKNLLMLTENIQELLNANYNKVDVEIDPLFPNSEDFIWASDKIRKAHMQVTDARDTKKLYMMHINIFPFTNSPAPILGLDIIAGENKITGAFFDFSPVSNEETHIDKKFIETVRDTSWKKIREMPEWAREIFSSGILAVSNIRDHEEVERFYDIVLRLTEYYVKECEKIDLLNEDCFKEKHNTYCRMQKMNPALHRSINSSNVSETKKNEYLNTILFEEI